MRFQTNTLNTSIKQQHVNNRPSDNYSAHIVRTIQNKSVHKCTCNLIKTAQTQSMMVKALSYTFIHYAATSPNLSSYNNVTNSIEICIRRM